MHGKNSKYYRIVILMCGMSASSIGVSQNTPGVFYTPVSDAIGVLRGTFALHITLSVLTIAVLSLAIPQLLKRFSIKTIVTAGAALMAGSTYLMSRSSLIWQFYALGIVRGVGAALCANVPITIIINSWFQKRNGTATSISLSFSGLAGAICSPILARCISQFGWRSAYVVQALMILFFMLPVVLVPFHPTPEQEGMVPFGYAPEAADDAARPDRAPTAAPSFLSLPFLGMAVIGFLHVSITSISQHISGYALSLGMSADFGATMLSFIMTGNILMKLVIGALSDRFGPLRASVTMILLNVLAIGTILAGARLGNRVFMLGGSLLFGSVYAVGAVGLALLTKYFFGAEHYGAVFPTLNLIHTIGGSASLSLIGYIYDFTGSYTPAFLIAVAFHAVDLLLLAIIAATLRRKAALRRADS